MADGPWGKGRGGPPHFGGGSFSGSEFKMPDPFANKKFLPFLIAGLIVVWLMSGLYRVLPDEQGVVLRFGEWVRTTPPGLHVHWPFPVESVVKPKITRSNRVDVGFRTQDERYRRDVGENDSLLQESLMLTKDENILDMHFTVLWRIADAGAYLFNIRDPESTVRAAAESAMREVVGRTKFDLAVTMGREEIALQAAALLQKILDEYDAGVMVENIQLQKVDPPTQVIDAFNDVQRARQDKDREVNLADAYRNDLLPRARGKAQGMVAGAEAYKERLIREAEGESQRFKAVYGEYRKAPQVTRDRMYIEAMQKVLQKADTIVIDQQGQKGVVPYLPLEQVKAPKAKVPAVPQKGSAQ